MSIADLVLRLARHRVLSAREGYALWADTYSSRPLNTVLETEQAAMTSVLKTLRPVRALDVGTGTGRAVPALTSAGAHLIVGVDLSMNMLACHASGALLICGDGCHLPILDSSVDLVCSSLMTGDVADLASWSSEAARVLEPGGHLVYSDFHPASTADRACRTFRTADGRLVELACVSHTIDEHLAYLAGARLTVKAIREPHTDASPTPVVVVFHAVKPGRVPTRRS